MYIPEIPMVDPDIPAFIWGEEMGSGQYWYRDGKGTWHDGRCDQWSFRHDWVYSKSYTK